MRRGGVSRQLCALRDSCEPVCAPRYAPLKAAALLGVNGLCGRSRLDSHVRSTRVSYIGEAAHSGAVPPWYDGPNSLLGLRPCFFP